LETKSLGGHILDLKIKIWFPLKTHEGAFTIPLTFLKSSAGILKTLGG
jgi:hypothetical protein